MAQGADRGIMSEELKPPYISKIEDLGDFEVWLVNGSYIRSHMDIEFTNIGQHFRFNFIPEKEFWIDQGYDHNEYNFFIDHLLIEHKLMAKGMPYDRALIEADRVERRERHRADVGKIARKQLPNINIIHERLWKKLENGLEIWIVRGRLVRAVDVDFTIGGHDYVYEYIPEGEVWIDNTLEESERKYALLHELHERNRMAEGMTYNQAHAEASRLELRYRHHPDELHEALRAEGWA